ncbi:MAG: efflux RND transporter periplasmic adaptor subunit [Paludibacteraceae bacterium]|nr:efflux RND transporter periplasmic adaptor subunit [Paludibacteraceae bacterium]
MKKFLIILFAVVLAGALVWWFFVREKQFAATYQEAKIERADLSVSVSATGTVEPVSQVEVGTQVSGIVSRLYVDYNSHVKKGQVIAELDKTNLLSELASKRSNLSSAKSEYDYQLKNYTRQKTLHEQHLIADADYETAYNTYLRAKNSYEIAKNDLDKAQTNLGYATIYSPIDGVVLSKSVEEGQTVASSFNTPTLFVIANDLTNMQVVANVDEADIGNVQMGQKVVFTVDAFPNESFQGQVTQVRQEATTSNNVVTYEVVISAPNPDLKLKPGLTANVTIYTMERQNAVCVASKALRFDPSAEGNSGPNDTIVDCKGRHKLWTRKGHVFTAHPVEIGITSGMKTEILSGMNVGESVVVAVENGRMPHEMKQDPSQKTEKSPFMPSRPGGKRNR